MKTLKKIIALISLTSLLITPAFAYSSEAALQNKEIFDEVYVDNNTLNKKIESIEEVSSSKEKSTKKDTLNYSPWAIDDLNEVQFMGIYPIENLNSNVDFRNFATAKDLETIFKLSKEKLASAGIETNNFKFKNTTRLETLKSISALLNDEHKINNLQDKNIFKGLVDEDYLNSDIPLQEMLALYRRAVSQKLEENNQSSKGFFYEVKNKNNTVYMLGSIHVGATKMYPINKNITNALKDSSKIYMEIDLTNRDEIKKANEKAYYESEGVLKKDLGDQLYKRVVQIFEKYGVPEDKISKLRPWAVYNNLSNNPNGSQIGAALGVENYFLTQALINNIPLDQLETAEYQSSVLADFNKESYIEMIENIVGEIETNSYKNMDKSMNELINAWINGDEDKLVYLTSGGKRVQREFSEALTSDRDKNMAKKIDALLKQDGQNTYFILVGSAHLVPENSVTGILKNMGYDVERKTFKEI